MNRFFFIVSLLISVCSFAQNNKQNIRGVVTDKLSQMPITGASIQLIFKGENKGDKTDSNGVYILENISPERYEIKVSHTGYKDMTIPDIICLLYTSPSPRD